MFRYTKYNPAICIGLVLVILFIIWLFTRKNESVEFIGFNPLYPDICISDKIETREKDNQVCIAPKGGFVSKGERICRETLEKIYGVPFQKDRPEWLINPETGRRLELDCYNDDLKLAVEYNGRQHYEWPNFPGQTQEEFIAQVRRDQLKIELCDRHGVYLITVPYTKKHKDIPNFILSFLPEDVQIRIREEKILD